MTDYSLPARFVAAAVSLVGVPFRMHGRDPVMGLDCVGLVAASLDMAGRKTATPIGYSLRNREIAPFLGFAQMNGFAEVHTPIQQGDLLLCSPGPAQFRLAISAPDQSGIIHAHAGLRRVTLTPGALPWPPLKHWRLTGADGE